MSYTPTNWKTGDVVTSAKLNKLEQGVAAAGFLKVLLSMTVGETTITLTTDKTAGEITDALPMAVLAIVSPEGNSIFPITDWSVGDGLWIVNCINTSGGTMQFSADSEDSPMTATMIIQQ